jgi:hypothetical protein
MHDRCQGPRNLNFESAATSEQATKDPEPELLSNSSRAYIEKMKTMNEVSAKILQIAKQKKVETESDRILE